MVGIVAVSLVAQLALLCVQVTAQVVLSLGVAALALFVYRTNPGGIAFDAVDVRPLVVVACVSATCVWLIWCFF